MGMKESWLTPGVGGLGELPALRDGSQWIVGFDSIVDYVHHTSKDVNPDLDGRSPGVQADITASVYWIGFKSIGHIADERCRFSSLIESHGQPLLDLNLYVSRENYVSATRPAYSNLLHWPEQWLIPSQRRAAAQSRTESLVDLDGDDTEPMRSQSTSGLIPHSLLSSRPSISALVKQPRLSSRFRLTALADAFLEPIQRLLGQKRYLLTEDGPTRLDCVAFAYLSLARIPSLPEPWLAELMLSRYPTLCVYLDEFSREVFGRGLDDRDASPTSWPQNMAAGSESSRKEQGPALPWKTSTPPTLFSTASALLENGLDSIPVVQHYRETGSSSPTLHANPTAGENAPIPPHLLSSLLPIAGFLTALGAYLFSRGFPPLEGYFSPKSETYRLNDLGEAGALLSVMPFQRT